MKLELTQQELDIVVAGLLELPVKVSLVVLQSIEKQVVEQKEAE